MANFTIPCASLYVGDLHPDVTEAILYEKFKTHGNVLSIRVCRDLVTRKSLGYAYVNFRNGHEAKNAMESLNFVDILHRPCRIMWSQRNAATCRSGNVNIFIKNLDTTITVKEINDTFAIFGEIRSCKLQQDDNGDSKGFAFVNFAQSEAAEKAIEAINGKMIRNKIVYVAKFQPRSQGVKAEEDFTECHVENLPAYFDVDSLTELFGSFGEIVSTEVMIDRDDLSKCVAVVSFKKHEQAVAAINSLNGHVIEDTTWATKRKEPRVCIYIDNLSSEITDDRLREEFTRFGHITKAKVVISHSTNSSKGCGFVVFSGPDEATQAASQMNGKMVADKPIYVAIIRAKGDLVATLRSQRIQT